MLHEILHEIGIFYVMQIGLQQTWIFLPNHFHSHSIVHD